MAWARFDDGYDRNAKILSVPPSVRWLHAASITYCRRQGSKDGFMTDAEARGLAVAQGMPRSCPRLVAAQLWDKVPGGFAIHDYRDYLPDSSAPRVAAFRERRRQGGEAAKGPLSSGLGLDNGELSQSLAGVKPELSGNQAGVKRELSGNPADHKEDKVTVTGPVCNEPVTRARALGTLPIPIPSPIPPPTGVGITDSLRSSAQKPETPSSQPSKTGLRLAPLVGELMPLSTAADLVGLYVDLSVAIGTEPIPSAKARIGKGAKELLAAGKAPELVAEAIGRLVERHRPLNALDGLLSEIEREMAGHPVLARPRPQQVEESFDETYHRLAAESGNPAFWYETNPYPFATGDEQDQGKEG